MEEARCCAILDEAIEELLTQVAKKEVKLQDQRIQRDQKKKKKVEHVERLPDGAPGESCAGCLEIEERYLRLEAVSHREEKVWQRERELLEGEARLKDREIAHLTDVADEYKGLYESLYESNSQLVASMEAPPVAEPAADSRELNEYGDVGAR